MLPAPVGPTVCSGVGGRVVVGVPAGVLGGLEVPAGWDVAGAGVAVDGGFDPVVAGGVELIDGGGVPCFGGQCPGGGEPELPTGLPGLDSVGVDVGDDDVPVGVGRTVKLGGCGGRLRLGGGGKDPGIGGVLAIDVVVDGAGVVGQSCLILPGCGGQWWCSAATAWLREEPGGVWLSQCWPFSLAPAP